MRHPLRYLRNALDVHHTSPRPLQLIHFVTARCNLRCQHCFFRDRLSDGAGDLTLDQLTWVVRSLPRPLESVVLTGGEPFLRADLPELCQLYEQLNHTRSLFIDTNGFDTAGVVDTVERILASGRVPLTVQVSLDGPRAQHNAIRQSPQAFDHALETLQQLRRLRSPRLQLKLLTTLVEPPVAQTAAQVTEQTTGLLEAVDRHGVAFGCEPVRDPQQETITLPGTTEATSPAPGYAPPSLAALAAARRFFGARLWRASWSWPPLTLKEAHFAYANLLHSQLLLRRRRPIIRCLAGRAVGVIYPDGQVALCEQTRPIGSLAQHDFDFNRVWLSAAARDLRRRVPGCACTHACFVFPSLIYNPANCLRLLTCAAHVGTRP